MQTNPLIACTPEEVSQLFAYHMAQAKESSGPEFDAHYARAAELAGMLPDTPLELQVAIYA